MKLLTNYNADLFPLHFTEIIPSLELLLNGSAIKFYTLEDVYCSIVSFEFFQLVLPNYTGPQRSFPRSFSINPLFFSVRYKQEEFVMENHSYFISQNTLILTTT